MPLSNRRGRANPVEESSVVSVRRLHSRYPASFVGNLVLSQGTHTDVLPSSAQFARGESICSGDGNGRRSGLRIRVRKRSGGSNPSRSTSARPSAKIGGTVGGLSPTGLRNDNRLCWMRTVHPTSNKDPPARNRMLKGCFAAAGISLLAHAPVVQ